MRTSTLRVRSIFSIVEWLIAMLLRTMKTFMGIVTVLGKLTSRNIFASIGSTARTSLNSVSKSHELKDDGSLSQNADTWEANTATKMVTVHVEPPLTLFQISAGT